MIKDRLQIARGSAARITSFLNSFRDYEIIFNTDTNRLGIALPNKTIVYIGTLDVNDIEGFLMDVTYDNEEHTLTFSRKNKVAKVVDLPIESLIKGLEYNEEDQSLDLTLEDDSVVSVPLNVLVVGLASETWVNTNFVEKEEDKGLSTNDLTDALKSDYDAAHAHSQAPHAPTEAQANVIESIKVNGSALTPTEKAVDIILPESYEYITNYDSVESLPTIPIGDSEALTAFATQYANTLFIIKPLGLVYDYYPSTTSYRCLNDFYTKDEIDTFLLNSGNTNRTFATYILASDYANNNYSIGNNDVNIGDIFYVLDSGNGLPMDYKWTGSVLDPIVSQPNTVNSASGINAIAPSDEKYPTEKAVSDFVTSEIANIPATEVPTISTDIEDDETSDTKTASPKAVKTYVDNAINSAILGLLGGES